MKVGTDMRFGSAKPFRRGLRTVVTGGAGFIGSHLCDQLIQRGDTVICVDNLFTGAMTVLLLYHFVERISECKWAAWLSTLGFVFVCNC